MALDASPERLADYVESLFAGEDELLRGLREEMERRGLPMIQVPAATGRFLQVLAAAASARRVLEIGTLGGYSAIWMARAMPPDGRLLTLEKEAEHAALARSFLERAGLADRVEVREGPALDLLPAVGPEGGFDLVFIDADKESYPAYLDHAARLLREGGVVAADNALWRGRVLEETPEEQSTRALQAFNRSLASDARFRATLVPVGDGVAVGVRSAR